MPEPEQQKRWWETAPAILGAVTAVIVAATGLISALGGLGFLDGQEDKIGVVRPQGPPTPTPAAKPAKIEIDQGVVDRKVREWVDASLSRDVDRLTGLADLPFYLYGDMIVRGDDFREIWRGRVSAPNYPTELHVLGIETVAAPGYRQLGEHSQLPEAVQALHLAAADVTARVNYQLGSGREARVIMLFRKQGQGYKISGVCCLVVEPE